MSLTALFLIVAVAQESEAIYATVVVAPDNAVMGTPLTAIIDGGYPAYDVPRDPVVEVSGNIVTLTMQINGGGPSVPGTFHLEVPIGRFGPGAYQLFYYVNDPVLGPLLLDSTEFVVAEPIPTLSQWGMILLATALGVFGAFRVQRRI